VATYYLLHSTHIRRGTGRPTADYRRENRTRRAALATCIDADVSYQLTDQPLDPSVRSDGRSDVAQSCRQATRRAARRLTSMTEHIGSFVRHQPATQEVADADVVISETVPSARRKRRMAMD
jgi:hypothetical protein